MQFCKHCGASIPDARVTHCPACGAPCGTVQHPRVPRPEQREAYRDPVPTRAVPPRSAAARGLQPQHLLLIVLTLLVITLGAVVLWLTRERPTEPGSITYVEAPAAEGENEPSTTTAQPTPTATQPAATQPGSAKASAPATPAPASGGAYAESFRGFSYHVPSGFVLTSTGASDTRIYYNESLDMTITVTVMEVSDPFGVLAGRKATLDGDGSLRTTYSDGRDNWFVRSGYDGNGWVFYSKNKVYTERGNTFAAVDFSYPNDAQKSTRDAILTNFVNDFGLA